MVIDLRDNGGGSLQEANQLQGCSSNTARRCRFGPRRAGLARRKASQVHYYDGPLAVMINRLAHQPQRSLQALFKTMAAASLLVSSPLVKARPVIGSPQEGQLKITESKFYRISGESTQHRGVCRTSVPISV
ncbi:MAG: hypothetical protein CM15mP84_08090 [Cellvibrionales bacterium]|nr:MAG: hypothetical protein CM15mP84_08090 [Cellvibrionales bacterium]